MYTLLCENHHVTVFSFLFGLIYFFPSLLWSSSAYRGRHGQDNGDAFAARLAEVALVGGFKGDANSGTAYGRLYLVRGIDMQFSPPFPACSKGNPRFGLPDRMRALFLEVDLATWTLVREGVRWQWPAGAPSTYEKHQMSPLVFARGSKRHMPSSFGNVILLYVVEVEYLVCMLSGVARVPNCVSCGLPCQCLVCLMAL
jgi:hypothetical protein